MANWITLSRYPLLVINVLVFYLGTPSIRLAAVGLLFVGLMLDTVDGMVARKTKTTSMFGSMFDIAVDRTYELVLWICFAQLGFISVAIPLLVIARTALTDAFRGIEAGQGTAPFDQHRTRLGRFLVASAPMRIGYQAAKTVTFCGLALVQALEGAAVAEPLLRLFQVTAWLAAAICLLRGGPVVGHALRHHSPFGSAKAG